MPEHLFISDLHLSAERPEVVQFFLRFIKQRAIQTDHLYILGDLFDVWIGDDDRRAPIPEIVSALKHLTQSGTHLYFMYGNRDFLIGDDFCRDCGAELLSDPKPIELFGTPTLLMHGDLLCTDDLDYQAFRRQVRHPDFALQFLSLSLDARREQAKAYREQSGEANANKAEVIMDVNQQAVMSYLTDYGADRLIHGHTHRPADHPFTIDGKDKIRHVLGEWHDDSAEIISVTEDGVTREKYTRAC
ncbi:MAG: UDP-2,3-diacylglucosamine diphosphatase [Candidatus Thiodiazotropha sp. (ex Myrtea sp. 'scaly one' KF741663)]|nr:UDP-2,3-diacylglucosamine diphosphatase [Candidatus Thiodiazotropha sp. (ex Myrtea sp. 'scaly one' KF741663)]